MASRSPARRQDFFQPFDRLPVHRQGEGFRLLRGDALELLPRIDSRSVDLIFADPPYHLSNGGSTCQGGRRVSVDKGRWDASLGLGADHDFNRRWLSECRRILKPSGTIWVSGTQHVIFSLGFAMQELGFHLLNTITWFKPNASPNLACRFFTHSTELVIWAAPERTKPLLHTFNYPQMKAQNGGKQMRDVWPMPDQSAIWPLPTPGKSEKREGRHPTQKPIALLDRVITASTHPGDLVVDPFNGSGTTGVVAVARGRRFVGIDLDAGYLDLTARRIASIEPGKSPPRRR